MVYLTSAYLCVFVAVLVEFTPLKCASAINLSQVPYEDGEVIRKQRWEKLTHGFRILNADVSASETVDDVDDDPLCVCHDEMMLVLELGEILDWSVG
jgi:hypothetical protein